MNLPTSQVFESLLPEQLSFLRSLCEQGVEFTIVGGYAMRCLGHLRKTHDLDIVIKQTQKNVARFRYAVEALESSSTSTIEELLLQPEKKIVWNSVEVFSTMSGFSYAEIENDSHLHQVQEFHVRTMSLAHMKRAKVLALNATERQDKREIDATDLAFLLPKSEA